MFNIDPALYRNHSKAEVQKAMDYLSYKTDLTELPKHESESKPTLYIFRHGQTEDNANFIFSGWRDPELTTKGKDEALLLAEKLKDKKIQMLISSPQKRAVETMKLAMSKNTNAKKLKIHTDPRIKERSYGDFQGKSKLKVYLENPENAHRIRRDFNNQPPNGESVKTVCKRVAEFCDEIVPLMKKNNINVAISCHGNSIRGFRRYFEHLGDESTANVETPLGKDYLSYVIE